MMEINEIDMCPRVDTGEPGALDQPLSQHPAKAERHRKAGFETRP
jgi:hypothetical protein